MVGVQGCTPQRAKARCKEGEASAGHRAPATAGQSRSGWRELKKMASLSRPPNGALNQLGWSDQPWGIRQGPDVIVRPE